MLYSLSDMLCHMLYLYEKQNCTLALHYKWRGLDYVVLAITAQIPFTPTVMIKNTSDAITYKKMIGLYNTCSAGQLDSKLGR